MLSITVHVRVGRKSSPPLVKKSLPSTGQKLDTDSVTPPTPHSPELVVDNPIEEDIEVKKVPTLPSSAKLSFEHFRKQALENAERVSTILCRNYDYKYSLQSHIHRKNKPRNKNLLKSSSP